MKVHFLSRVWINTSIIEHIMPLLEAMIVVHLQVHIIPLQLLVIEMERRMKITQLKTNKTREHLLTWIRILPDLKQTFF